MTVAWSHDINSTYLAYSPYTNPFTVTVWKNNTGTFSKLSGSKVSALSTLSGTAWDMRFSPDDTNLALAISNGSQQLLVFSFNSSTSTFTPLATQPAQPTSNGNAIAWSPDGSVLVTGVDGSPYIYAYSRSGTGGSATFTPISFPSGGANNPTNSVNSLAWSQDGQYLAAGTATTSGTSLYIYRPE